MHTAWTVTKVVCFTVGALSIAVTVAVAVLVLRDEHHERDTRFDAELRQLLEDGTS